MIKLGSLFDGSGGFPLAGVINGMEPVWASEIEPYPMRVTAARFPHMKQLGDVTKINGKEIEPVDVITFGSPCQDLSVAGKQAGIHEGERSSLFFEAIRIIKEMRNGTSDQFPRFAVWENVPGAFSSNKGEDFLAVLEAFGSVCGGEVSAPRPPKGKWLPAGCIVGDGWSVAWRVYDAQFWGVPQRRKRIYLIADFGSERAGEILFEQESGGGDIAKSRAAGEATAGDAEGSAGGNDHVRCLNPWDAEGKRVFSVDGAMQTLFAGEGGHLRGVCYAIDSMSSNSMKSSNPHSGFHEEQKARTLDTHPAPTCNQGGNVIVQIADKSEKYATGGIVTHDEFEKLICLNDQGGNIMNVSDKPGALMAQMKHHEPIVCYDCRGNGNGEISPALTGDHQNRVTDYTACLVAKAPNTPTVTFTQGSYMECRTDGKSASLLAMDYKQAQGVVIPQKDRKYIVRRLTPLECCRLQGFPDWWTDGVEGSDTAQYKMWGNGIALPCAVDVIERIAREIRKE